MRGYWAPKPGSICPDGSIVVGRCGPRVEMALTGSIYLTPSRAQIAQRYGWKIIATAFASNGDDWCTVRRDTRPPFPLAAPPPPSLGAALYGFLSTRCAVSSQHKLPTLDEIKSTIWAEFFEPAAIGEAVRRGIADGRIFRYGPYLSDHEIEVM